MSNHSSNIDPEIARIYAEQLRRDIERSAGDLRLGPTGLFPQGQLTPQDEGEIRIAITHTRGSPGQVVINFGTPVSWIGFTAEQAEEIAQTLLEHAAKARCNGG